MRGQETVTGGGLAATDGHASRPHEGQDSAVDLEATNHLQGQPSP